MTRNATSKLRWLALSSMVLLAMLAVPVRVLAHGPTDGGADNDTFWGLFDVTFFLAIPVFLLVEGLLIYSIIRYRRRHKDEMPEQIHGHTGLEITWTVLSFVLVTVLFVLTLRALQTAYEADADSEDALADYTILVDGYMFNWDYEYLIGEEQETGVMTTRTLNIPTNRNVLLKISSRDVQHSFWVYELAGKVDAIPGYTNTMWLNVDEPGLYQGNCAEYCGLNHYNMLIEVNAMEPSDFDAWLAGKMNGANNFQAIGTDLDSPLPMGDAARGESLFNELGCNACHGEQDLPSGPAIGRMASDAREMNGDQADLFLRESILLPCEELADGYANCIMPQDYGEKMSAQDLSDVIAYLLAQ